MDQNPFNIKIPWLKILSILKSRDSKLRGSKYTTLKSTYLQSFRSQNPFDLEKSCHSISLQSQNPLTQNPFDIKTLSLNFPSICSISKSLWNKNIVSQNPLEIKISFLKIPSLSKSGRSISPPISIQKSLHSQSLQ